MNTIEEKLWNYIDGSCTPDEQEAIARLIEHDEVYSQKYNELLTLNLEFAAMELDEPPMAFTYNIIEAIRTEQALKPLKSAVDKRIIAGIAAFFVLTIAVLLIFTLSSINFSGMTVNVALPADVKLPAASPLVKTLAVKGFLLFDVVLALFLTDTYLRRKKHAKQA